MPWSTVLALLHGAATTVWLCVASIAAGIPFGLLIALVRIGNVPIVGVLAALYVSFMRAAPLVTLVMLIFFGLPIVGIALDPVPAAIVALTLNTSAFNSEIWRGAILDFPRDQLDAAYAMGMTRRVAFRQIVMPQVARASLPALVNEMTYMVKGSPAIAVAGVVELTRGAREVGASTYEPLPPFLFAAALYAGVLLVLVRGARRLELSIHRRYGVL